MEADFSGWATKAGVLCKDGVTIMPDAFKHQDTMQVPLVWMHGHDDPENVLGHAVLEHRPEGVYCHAYFNDTPKAKHARTLVDHKDIKHMSIWANDLIKRSKNVIHGAIREVSLVLAGANPGAVIENVRIQHSDGDETELEHEVIIHTGLDLEVKHADKDEDEESDDSDDDSEKTVQDVIDSMTDEQKDVLAYLVGAVAGDEEDETDEEDKDDSGDSADSKTKEDTEVGTQVKHNAFEQDNTSSDSTKYVISHADAEGIFSDAMKLGSLKDAVEGFAIQHGINQIDLLFPEATKIDNVPEWIKRRTEWVGGFLGGTRKTPFSRIKTMSADITHEEARAKGYVKGTMKKEEFFGLQQRVTTPTTVYKKQKLDRDDIIDITDFDVVAWLKGEMRIMLDEEIARAGLIGDGRDVAHEDKINEGNIRPIAKDNELYTTQLYVNLDDANSSIQEFIDQVISTRHLYKGSGLPTMYTTELYLSRFLLLKDTLGRFIYNSVDELATKLRVSKIVPVEVLEDEPSIIAILVNPSDYVYGATRGGEVNMFDDFDIDYNQYKYLIETRLCGALVKVKSAMVYNKAEGTDVLVAPQSPTFNSETNVVTIPSQTGVTYVDLNDDPYEAGAQEPLAEDEEFYVKAVPASGYYFETGSNSWTFVGQPLD